MNEKRKALMESNLQKRKDMPNAKAKKRNARFNWDLVSAGAATPEDRSHSNQLRNSVRLLNSEPHVDSERRGLRTKKQFKKSKS